MNSYTAIFKDFLERAGWSFGQQFITVLLAAGAVTSVVGFPWEAAVLGGAGAALVSVILTGLQYLTGLTDLNRWEDIVVRAAKTFLASLLSTIALGGAVVDLLHVDWGDALQLAAVTTIAAIAKGLIVSPIEPSSLTTPPPTSAATTKV